ncbi:DMT family transporter [Thiobacillus sedimenti]|uniref:DMT family transporter n=1 Tax=Thiobacillus sedimenti TaxID=3110231 RepID=A0ABZ1CLC7_9PROT|nr:DMT family transporter [Thiobacillus sp. SCUT-2]WRS40149.1 DMT family transporter [Thiobacillus sp. SCUT-2]
MKSGWMLVAAALFALMSVLVKHASATFSPAELVFYRSAFGLVAIWSAVAVRHRKLLGPLVTPHIQAHFWRGLSGFAALVLFFFALARLPLATAVTLNYTAPLFLAALSAWWLREEHGRGLVGAVLLGFAGIVMLLRPQLAGQAWLPAVGGLVSGMLAAVAYVNVKQLGRLGEPEWRVVFYFTLLSTAGGALWMAFAGFHPPQAGDWPWLVGIGVTATVAQLALTRAYHRGRTLAVGALAYATVGFSALYGVLLLGERLPFLAWVGMAVVAAAGVWAVFASTPRRVDSL